EDARQVVAELGVEGIRPARIVPRIVPPEPIAAFGDVELAPGPPETLRVRQWVIALVFDHGAARARQRLPGGVLVRLADPGLQIAVDPTAGIQGVQGCALRELAQELANRNAG